MALARGLGKGFDALIPTQVDAAFLEEEGHRIQKLLIQDVTPNKEQPRKYFDDAALDELAESIRVHGVLQPIIVVQKNDKTYRIVAGERRYRAALKAGLEKIPAIVRTLDELKELELALVENVQRVDLNPLEQAMSIARLQQQFSLTYAEIAKKLGKAVTTVNNIVRLLQLPPVAQDALSQGKITEGHARALLALKDDTQKQLELLRLIVQHNWSVRQAEQYVIALKSGAESKTQAKKRTAAETPDTKLLGKKLNTQVRVRRTAKGGQLLIAFTDDSDMQRIIGLLS